MEEQELPVGWTSYCLSDVGGTKGGKTPSKSRSEFWHPATINWTSPKDMKAFELRESEDLISKLAVSDGGMEVLPAGSVLMVTRSGILSHTFPVAIAGKETAINQDIKAIKPIDGLDERFLAYTLKSLESTVLGSCSKEGTTVASVETKLLERLLLPLAPLNEQRRIAAKLDTTIAAVEACRQRLDGVAAILKRFRQAVLAAATTGELTREWREERGIDMDWPPCELTEIAEIQGGMTKDSKKQLAEYPEIPYLRVANVQRGYLDLSEVSRIKVPPSRLDALLLKAGDILFNEGGDRDKVGRGWIWEGQIRECVFQNHVFRARLYNSEDEPKFVSWWSNTRGADHFLGLGKQTTNLASISKATLGRLPINLPPPDEQREIVSRVEDLFSLAHELEAKLTAARRIVDRLTPALLAKAFRGELVPQDRSDEPASVLLERIRAAREAEATAGKPSRRGRRKAAATPDQLHLDAAPVPPDLLSGLLQECGALSERALLAASELEPDRFRAQLELEVGSGNIRAEIEGGKQLLIVAREE